MQRVTASIKKIERMEGARVDRNFGQGLAALQTQYDLLELEAQATEQDLRLGQSLLHEVIEAIAPEVLPEDYLYFLTHYGGLGLQRPGYRLFVDGIGPMTEEWYDYVLGDASHFQHGLLSIGLLVLRQPSTSIPFYLDLGGAMKRHAVFSITAQQDTPLSTVLEQPERHRSCWKQLATSFSAWLELLARTEGHFGYLADAPGGRKRQPVPAAEAELRPAA